MSGSTVSQAVPQHVAVIMDGNGRWAKSQGKARIKGHEVGAESVRAVLKACRESGVKYLTLYAFSSENWVRPMAEIKGLMALLDRYLTQNSHELHENEIRFRVMGEMADFPMPLQKLLNRVIDETKEYDKGHLILALSYGGRREIVQAVKKIAVKTAQGELTPEDITEETVAQHLYLPDVPDPDLMIRTSGEMRLSNFLLWQLSYAELYVTDTFWPDFREPQFAEALRDYAGRHRRFGDVE